MFINDWFLIKLITEICNFADDNTIHSCGKHLTEIITDLEIDLSRLLHWFGENGMASNPKKFQLVLLGLNTQTWLHLNIERNKISATDGVKFLGIEIDNKLKFDKHVKTLRCKVNKKINAFSRLNTHISREQALLIYNAVILSNFNYCSLI